MNGDARAKAIRARVAADQAALQGRKGQDPVVDARSLRASAHLDAQQVQAGRRCRDRLSALNFQIDDAELLAGRIKPAVHSESEIREARDFLAELPVSPGQTGHCELAVEDLFRLGIDGLTADIATRAKTADSNRADVYRSFIDALHGLSVMIENGARPAEIALAGAAPLRRTELETVVESCHRIAHHPPRTFQDALQLIWFLQIGVMVGDSVALVCSGHLDRRLIHFYEADLAAGILNRQRALELIEGLYFLTNDLWPGGSAFSVMVGGRDAAGRDVTNDLSYLCLEAIRRTGLVYPTVGVCWHEDTPEALTNLATELIADGYTTPAFFNDAVIQDGLQRYGVPAAEACDYLNSTCVEISTCGSSNIWVASPYFSLCGILVEHLNEIVASDCIPDSYEVFVASYFERLGQQIAEAVRRQNEMREERRRHGRKPLQSVFTRDCITRGRDIDDGGARYNWVECSFVGLANLVDSLQVIREEVFSEEKLSFAELKHLLDSDFAGREPRRQKFLNYYPKYGWNDPGVDGQITRVMAFITKECAKHRMQPDDSPFIPGTFCWVMHERLGAQCGATPDGRRAGFPFADGAGPAQGREKLGPTAAIQSVTAWDHTPLIGGSAFNMKFTRTLLATADAVEKLKRLILTFLRQGGFETQINVVDNAVLRQAMDNPDDYADLVVRIGGYTDYFTRLSPGMQQEIVQRTQYDQF